MQLLPESERLLFRPHLITDLDAFCAMEMDINVRRYVGGYPLHNSFYRTRRKNLSPSCPPRMPRRINNNLTFNSQFRHI
jgi:hypothetical protein